MKTLLYVSAALFGLSFWQSPAYDPDLGWHLLGGSWILSHGSVPTEDFINAFNGTWVDYHWLAQILFFKLYLLGGFTLLSMFLGFICAYLGVVILDCIFLAGRPRMMTAFALILFSMFMIREVTSVRPQAISLLFIALALRRLLGNPRREEFPYLLLLTILCVNIHVYWVVIPALWFIFRCVPSVTRGSYPGRSAWLGLAVLGLSGFISPYGIFGDTSLFPAGVFTNYALIADYVFGSSELKGYIGEFKSSLAAAGLPPWLVLAYVAIAFSDLRVRRVAAKLPEAILAALFLFLAVRTLKFAALFAVCGLPFAVHSNLLRALNRRIPLSPRAVSPLAIGIFGLYAAYEAVTGCPLLINPAAELASYHPVDACRYIAESKPPIAADHKELRVLTYFDYGGWCRWSMYNSDPTLDARVTTDGRTQFVPFEHYRLSFDLYKVQYDWRNTLERWNPDAALVQKRFALAQFMVLAPASWKLVFQDENFAVFLPIRPKA